ncbi:MAG: sulfite exporter TauE/SafE family protein [Xanthobacteraceae bacterium]
MALIASLVGGVAGYGTGALMPLVLVPMLGAEPVVPILAMSALLTNASRVYAFLRFVSWRRAALVLAGAIPPCLFSAYGFTLLTGRGAQLLIGGMLMLTVPLRTTLRRRAVTLGDRGLLLGSVGYGAAVGGTVGAGVILLSLLMAAGLEGAAVIATDAVVSIFIGLARIAVFGSAGVINAQTIAFALLIGLVAFPGVFLAKAFVMRLPIHVHTAILDAVVLVGGAAMVFGALRGS